MAQTMLTWHEDESRAFMLQGLGALQAICHILEQLACHYSYLKDDTLFP